MNGRNGREARMENQGWKNPTVNLIRKREYKMEEARFRREYVSVVTFVSVRFLNLI